MQLNLGGTTACSSLAAEHAFLCPENKRRSEWLNENEETLQLGKTKFPMRGNLPNREGEWQKEWEENQIYQKDKN